MIVALPYSPDLPGGYDRFVSAITRYGKHPSHTLFVIAKEEHTDGAFELAMRLKEQFGRYFAISLDERRETRLQESNRMFLTALNALKEYQPTENEMPEPTMIYFDPTWRPMKQRWLDEFQMEYHLAGAPATFGCFQTKGGKGKILGPVAINRRWLGITKLLDFLPANTHWREFLAWEIINNGLQSPAIGQLLPAYIRPFAP